MRGAVWKWRFGGGGEGERQDRVEPRGLREGGAVGQRGGGGEGVVARGEGEAGEDFILSVEFLKARRGLTGLGVLADHRQVAAVLQLLLALRRLVDEHANLERAALAAAAHVRLVPLPVVAIGPRPDGAQHKVARLSLVVGVEGVGALQVGRAQPAGVGLGAADVALGPERERREVRHVVKKLPGSVPGGGGVCEGGVDGGALDARAEGVAQLLQSRFTERPGRGVRKTCRPGAVRETKGASGALVRETGLDQRRCSDRALRSTRARAAGISAGDSVRRCSLMASSPGTASEDLVISRLEGWKSAAPAPARM